MNNDKVKPADAALLRAIVESQAAVSSLDSAMKSDAGALVMITDDMADSLSALADVLTKIPPDMAEGLRGLVGYLVAHDMHNAAIRCADAAALFDLLHTGEAARGDE